MKEKRPWKAKSVVCKVWLFAAIMRLCSATAASDEDGCGGEEQEGGGLRDRDVGERGEEDAVRVVGDGEVGVGRPTVGEEEGAEGSRDGGGGKDLEGGALCDDLVVVEDDTEVAGDVGVAGDAECVVSASFGVVLVADDFDDELCVCAVCVVAVDGEESGGVAGVKGCAVVDDNALDDASA